MRLMSLCVTSGQRPQQRAENGVFQSILHALMGTAVLTVQFCHRALLREPAAFHMAELGSGYGCLNPTPLILDTYKPWVQRQRVYSTEMSVLPSCLTCLSPKGGGGGRKCVY